MRKYLPKVNTSVFTIISIIIASISILSFANKVRAREAEFDNGYESNYPSNYNDTPSLKSERDMLQTILDLLDSNNDSTTLPTITPSTNPAQSQGSNPSPTSSISIPPSTSFTAFRQCNYRNNVLKTNADGTTCSICRAGCGPTAVATALSIFGISADPVEIVKKYSQNNLFISCEGTNLNDAKKIFESYGLRTYPHLNKDKKSSLFASESGFRIDEVAIDIRNQVKNGWVVFALLKMCSGGCKHFTIITDIDSQNRVTSYDPYYEPPESSKTPINYSSRSFQPLYLYAFAVRR